MKIRMAVALSLLAASAAACSQGGSEAPAASPAATSAAPAPTETAPAAFADGGLRVALVSQLSSGDYFQQLVAGAEDEAKALNIELDVSSAGGDNDKHALNLEQAVAKKADAIIVDHGFAETIQPAVKKAVDAKIPVVAFDVDPGDSEVTTLDQDDHEIAGQALGALKQDTGGTAEVLYVYVAGFEPLDRRNETWTQFKKDNPGVTQTAQIGVVNGSTAAAVADQAKAALQAHPETTSVFAPYDEFAKGATLAINELGLQGKVKVYGADISTADIGVITAPDSPWVATSATDPANVGRVAVRAAALRIAGRDLPKSVVVPPTLLTRDRLVERKITNVQQLTESFPELATPDLARVPWK
ncbi:monosaccharide ABC transporter substrate-binding protein (CUT2 family) [Actinocorallia herbida]|uniref:Monosaccharide ABC transporter substrate-binding protein (CUT2 family) n=1 Tax=Actinocorallia herbida TaxID=58109 RepID=A0A3N1CWV6_9ACTN|nr:substrate-binding domain-containing protein [Actinocorallia herbida]ROO85780.1 monosaccharide ABC transporter substrate-binding protein (CUT2 family) [Actinocorallia herbida]